MTGVNWIDAVLVVFMAIGAAAGAYSYARNRKTYIDIGKAVFKAAWPYLLTLFKPYDTATQKKLDDSRRAGQEWDHINRRPRERK